MLSTLCIMGKLDCDSLYANLSSYLVMPRISLSQKPIGNVGCFVVPTGLKKNISHQNIVQQNGSQQRTKVTITTKSEAVSRTSSALIFRSFSRLRLAAKSSACDGTEILAMY